MNNNYWSVERKGDDLEHSTGFWKKHKYLGKHKSKSGKTVYEYAQAAAAKAAAKTFGNQVSDAGKHLKGYISGRLETATANRNIRNIKKDGYQVGDIGKISKQALRGTAGKAQSAANRALLKEDVAVAKAAAKAGAKAAANIVKSKANRTVKSIKSSATKVAKGAKSISSKLNKTVNSVKKKVKKSIKSKQIAKKVAESKKYKKASKGWKR